MLTGTEVDTRRCTVAEILVLGAGLCGLSTAMLLARDGHQVTVLERDPAAPPEPAQAWEAWERRGVNQFRLPHVMLPPWRARMERELPEVLDEVLAAGGLRLDTLTMLPESRRGPRRDGDERFKTVTARRPALRADLVVDCCGRRSPLGSWLEAIGAPRPAEEREDCGFFYYGRHFRTRTGELP